MDGDGGLLGMSANGVYLCESDISNSGSRCDKAQMRGSQCAIRISIDTQQCRRGKEGLLNSSLSRRLCDVVYKEAGRLRLVMLGLTSISVNLDEGI